MLACLLISQSEQGTLSCHESISLSILVLCWIHTSCGMTMHIDYIGCKISAKLGMLRKVRKVIPRESCLTLNNAMKLPVFNYCAVVWYSCSKADREYLDKPHRRAASIIEGYTVSQSQISHTFGWPTLHSRRDHPTSSPGLFPHDQKMGGAGKGPGIGWSRVQPKYS